MYSSLPSRVLMSIRIRLKTKCYSRVAYGVRWNNSLNGQTERHRIEKISDTVRLSNRVNELLLYQLNSVIIAVEYVVYPRLMVRFPCSVQTQRQTHYLVRLHILYVIVFLLAFGRCASVRWHTTSLNRCCVYTLTISKQFVFSSTEDEILIEFKKIARFLSALTLFSFLKFGKQLTKSKNIRLYLRYLEHN
jgi:hypothetical protein